MSRPISWPFNASANFFITHIQLHLIKLEWAAAIQILHSIAFHIFCFRRLLHWIGEKKIKVWYGHWGHWAGLPHHGDFDQRLFFALYVPVKLGTDLAYSGVIPALFVFSIDGPKQNAGSLLTLVSHIVYYALSHGTLGFAFHGIFNNHLFSKNLRNFHQSENG